MARSPSKFEYKKTLPGWEGSTMTFKPVQGTLRSFTNQHYPLGAKYYYDQKLGKKDEANVGCRRHGNLGYLAQYAIGHLAHQWKQVYRSA